MLPFATAAVTCIVVCLSVRWAYGWAVQKRLNRSRCRLMADFCVSKELCIILGPDPRGKAHFWVLREDVCRPMVTYLRMANLLVQRTRRTTAFATARGDVTRRRCGRLPNYLGHFVFSVSLMLKLICDCLVHCAELFVRFECTLSSVSYKSTRRRSVGHTLTLTPTLTVIIPYLSNI